MEHEISLSFKQPVDVTTEIRLVSISHDLTTTIRLDSGAEVSATPGSCFECDEFGRAGLELVSASFETGTAKLRHRWSETH
ncbi:MAG TPA: hypothetical protein VGO57_04440 [Verrucomicrobiae bacterium]